MFDARRSGYQILDVDLGPDDGPTPFPFAFERAVHPFRLARVPPASHGAPGRLRRTAPITSNGKTNRTDEPRPDLPLENHDGCQGEVDQRDENEDQLDPRIAFFTESGDVEKFERAETQQHQAGHGDRDEDRIHRGPTLFGPVHILQIEDQCELVEHQRSTHTEDRRQDGTGGLRTIDVDRDQRTTGDHHGDHTEHDVMHMLASGRDVARPPFHLRANHPDAEADEKEGGQEPEQEEQQRQSAMAMISRSSHSRITVLPSPNS